MSEYAAMFNFFRKCRGSRTGEPSEADFGKAFLTYNNLCLVKTVLSTYIFFLSFLFSQVLHMGRLAGLLLLLRVIVKILRIQVIQDKQVTQVTQTQMTQVRILFSFLLFTLLLTCFYFYFQIVGYLRATETKAVKELEKRRSGILTHETELDRKLDDVDMFMLNSITLYVIMVTGSSLSGVVVSKKIALYSLIVSVVSVFAVGLVGIAILSFKKLKKLKWKVDQVTDMRSTLFDEVEGLMNLLKGVNYGLESIADGEEAITVSMAKARLNKISNSLAPLSGNYQEDHMIFLTVTCVGCGLYLVLLAMWLYFSHAGKKCYYNFSFFL